MSDEGEFKRLIALYFDNLEYNIHRFSKEGALNSIRHFKKIHFKLIDEARKDFPDIGAIGNTTISLFEMKVLEWLLKWFGFEEEKLKTLPSRG